jgi:hypothetical protein
MKRSVTFTVLLALISTWCLSCAVVDGFGVEGSGNVITEEREVSDFNEIALSGSGVVNVEVTGTESLTIEAEDNIMPELETAVRGGRLDLETRRSIQPTTEIVYTITAASLDSIILSGSGAVTVDGVDTTDFSTDISGSGSVAVSGSASGSLTLIISGSGAFDGEDLTAIEGRVDVSGSGRAVVNVSDDLVISLSGSGAIEYIGSPTVEVDKSGSGIVTQRD